MKYIVKVRICNVAELIVEAESEDAIWHDNFKVVGLHTPLRAEDKMQIVEVREA